MIDIREDIKSVVNLDRCYKEKFLGLFKEGLTEEELIEALKDMEKINNELDNKIFNKA